MPLQDNLLNKKGVPEGMFLSKDAQEYINSLSEMEKKVLQIAIEHLETSFSLEKSIGFQKWLKTKNN